MNEIIYFGVLQTEMEQLRSRSHLNIDPVCLFFHTVLHCSTHSGLWYQWAGDKRRTGFSRCLSEVFLIISCTELKHENTHAGVL